MTHSSFNRRKCKQIFWKHINKVDPAIKFTVEGNQQYGAIPFLDTKIKPEADNTLSLIVYMIPTHTNQYLQWDSHHNLAPKYSVINTLTHRASTVGTKPELLNKEIHLRKALTKCKYPKWALDKVERKFINNNQEESNMGNNQGYLNEDDSNNPSGNP